MKFQSSLRAVYLLLILSRLMSLNELFSSTLPEFWKNSVNCFDCLWHQKESEMWTPLLFFGAKIYHVIIVRK